MTWAVWDAGISNSRLSSGVKHFSSRLFEAVSTPSSRDGVGRVGRQQERRHEQRPDGGGLRLRSKLRIPLAVVDQ